MHRHRFATAPVALFALVTSFAATSTAADAVAVTRWLTVDVPAPAPLYQDAPTAKKVDFVPEIDPRTWWPEESRGARAVYGAFELAAGTGRSITFATSYAAVDRFGATKFVLEAPGHLRLWIDGEEAGSADAKVEATKKLATGSHRVLVRCERNGEAGTLVLTATPDANGQTIDFVASSRHPPASYDEFRAVSSVGGLRMSPDGKYLAVQRTERNVTGDGAESWLDVIDLDLHVTRAAALCGKGATAVDWLDDSSALLVRQGTTLKSWRVADGTLRDVLKDEPGLGAVAASRDGGFIVFASTRGVADDPAGTAPKHRTELRERLSDWPTPPHLHVLDTATGVRRRLTAPGDYLADAFAIARDGKSLIFFKNVPRPARPWFASELHVLDLQTGADRLVTTLTMGFEGHPGLSPIALDPAGARIAFIAPPSELGSALKGREPNAFAPALWVTDLASGESKCVSEKFAGTVESHLHWSADGKRIAFLGDAGSRPQLIEIDVATLAATTRDLRSEAVQDVALSADDAHVAWVGSAFVQSPALYEQVAGDRGSGDPLLDPCLEARLRFHVAGPADVALVAADGKTPVDAWLYKPPVPKGSTMKLPLVVYYYGGATPTLRGWNDLHQFLVANGYAVLVLNPRGCGGYGRDFADAHVAEWGEVAGRDILAGLDQVLAKDPQLDATKVGCYGGSYGGFMTMWLVSHSDKFAAAVSMYGIADIASYFGDGTWGWTYGDQALANTYPWTKPEWFTEHSPLYQADKIHTPLLLLHGEADVNVPVNESEQMFTALKILGRDVELVRFPGEDHGLRGTWTNRVLHRTMLLEWFDKCLKGQPDAWKARWGR